MSLVELRKRAISLNEEYRKARREAIPRVLDCMEVDFKYTAKDIQKFFDYPAQCVKSIFDPWFLDLISPCGWGGCSDLYCVKISDDDYIVFGYEVKKEKVPVTYAEVGNPDNTITFHRTCNVYTITHRHNFASFEEAKEFLKSWVKKPTKKEKKKTLTPEEQVEQSGWDSCPEDSDEACPFGFPCEDCPLASND